MFLRYLAASLCLFKISASLALSISNSEFSNSNKRKRASSERTLLSHCSLRTSSIKTSREVFRGECCVFVINSPEVISFGVC